MNDEGIPATDKCNYCSRPAPLRTVVEGSYEGESFRFGYYVCRWHQAVETRRAKRSRALAATAEARM